MPPSRPVNRILLLLVLAVATRAATAAPREFAITAADRRIPYDHMSRAETCLVIFNDGDHFIFSGRERKVAG